MIEHAMMERVMRIFEFSKGPRGVTLHKKEKKKKSWSLLAVYDRLFSLNQTTQMSDQTL
jgi:hypothetical protein